MAKDFTSHNIKVLRKAIKGKGSDAIGRDTALEIFRRLAESVMNWVEMESYTYENITWNLTDSIGCAIYDHGTVIETFFPPQRSSSNGPRVISYHGQKITVYGRLLLREAVNNPEIASLGPFSFGVFAAAPYGLWVDRSLGYGGNNKRGKGWFSDKLTSFVEDEFSRLKNELINNK